MGRRTRGSTAPPRAGLRTTLQRDAVDRTLEALADAMQMRGPSSTKRTLGNVTWQIRLEGAPEMT